MPTVAIFESNDLMGSAETPIYQVFSLSEITSTSPLSNGDERAVVGYEPPSELNVPPVPSEQNSPDSLETNPDILRAEESFYVTPHTKHYEEAVYDTLRLIQSTCAIDVGTKCTPTNLVDVQTMDAFRQEVLTNLIEGRSVNEANLRGYRRLTSHADEWNHVGSHGDHHHSGREDGNNSDPHDGSDNESEEGHEHGHEHNEDGHNHDHRRHRHNRDRPNEGDYLFMGSLGYGSSGDTCLYQNYEQLAPACQSSVADLHMLRSQYWNEEQRTDAMMRNIGDLGVYYIVVTIAYLFIIAYAYRRASSSRKINSAIFSAIMANPALKQQVEMESGVTMEDATSTPRPCSRTCVPVMRVFYLTYIACLCAMALYTTSALIVNTTRPENPVGVFLIVFFIQAAVGTMIWRRCSSRRNANVATAVPMGEVIAMSPRNAGNGNGDGSVVQSQGGNNISKQEGQEKETETEGNFIEAYSVTTTTSDLKADTTTTVSVTRSNAATPGFFASILNAFDSRLAHTSNSQPQRGAVDGSYSALPSEESVHGMHSQGTIVTGGPTLSSPPTVTVTVAPKGNTNWI